MHIYIHMFTYMYILTPTNMVRVYDDVYTQQGYWVATVSRID